MTTPDTMGRVVPYDASKHEGFVLESWLRAWARSRAGVQMGVNNQDGPRWRAFFENYRPLVLTLLQTERVVVIEDAETPGVIWGWMACSHDRETVHDVVIKRELTKADAGEAMHEEARDMVRQVLGDLLEKRVGHTGELAAMRVLNMWPRMWHYDTTYIARKLVDTMRAGSRAA